MTLNYRAKFPSLLVAIAACCLIDVIRAASPVPFVNKPLVPTSAAPGSAPFTLTVNGANFVSGATVYWNGSARSTQFVSTTQLTASITANDVGTAGTATVVVGAPGTGAMSNLSYFSISGPQSIVTTPSSFALSSQQLGTDLNIFAEGDFNGDGKLDIATIGAFETSVFILLGNGDGTFQPPISYPVTANAYSIVVGDFNGDGKLDLAIEGAPAQESMVVVLLGKGDGTFTALAPFDGGALSFAGMIAGDFNGDGKLDLAGANADNNAANVAIFLGNGDGSFQHYTNVQIGSSGSSVTEVQPGDFNRDGKLDLMTLVAPSAGPAALFVLLGDGNGGFGSPARVITKQSASTFALGDINGDGVTDIVTSTGEGIEYLRGSGNGTFQSADDLLFGLETGSGVALADLNCDNRLDVVVTTYSSGNLIVMNEKTGFGAPASLAAGSEITASGGTATGDFNNDGRPDIILADAGVFLSVTSYLTPTSLSFPSEMLGMPGSPQAITLTNSGPQAIELTGFTFSGLDPKDFSETNDCDGAIRAHSSCTVDVTFQPLADETRSAYLSFEEGPNATQIAALSGYATGEAPIVELSGYQLNWPSVPVGTPGATAQVKLTNIGNETLTSLAITITGTNPSDFAITGRSCGADVFSSGGCLITVQFTPSATGTRSATLTFTDNAYNSPQTVSLSGTGA